MAGSNQGPFWNQDAVMAAGLAFAGMALLQSKLFPVVAKLDKPILSKLIVWWPLLLMVAGVVLWRKKSLEDRQRETAQMRSRKLGGVNESGNKA
jgi:hypothetical protein